ncbi:MAG: hypothetical protein QOF62_2064 [Pyrinomonadaceae bacterium]|nr:hypothetical protein [Pyrinomonadaceae bacterium]
MVLLVSPDPSHDDINDFMDEDQRAYWDTQQGTAEERVKFWEQLEDCWRSIPDPNEAELKQVMGDTNWDHYQRGENREGILNFYRRKWKKDRKAAARKAQTFTSPDNKPEGSGLKAGDASELFKQAETENDSTISQPDISRVNDSLLKFGEDLAKDQERLDQKVRDFGREVFKPHTPFMSLWPEPTPEVKRGLLKADKRLPSGKRASRRVPPKQQSQKYKKLAEGIFGVIAVIAGTQLRNTILSFLLVLGGWGLLVMLVSELELFSNSLHKSLRKFGNSVMYVGLFCGLFYVWQQTRPEPQPLPPSAKEIAAELAKEIPREGHTKLRGILIPGNDPSPLTDCPMAASAVAVYLGSSNVASTTSASFAVVEIGDEKLCYVEKTSDGMLISATIRDPTYKVVATITRNVFHAESLDYEAFSPDAQTLYVLNGSDQIVLFVRYLNPRAIKVLGQFYYQGYSPILIGEDRLDLGGVSHQGSCFSGFVEAAIAIGHKSR